MLQYTKYISRHTVLASSLALLLVLVSSYIYIEKERSALQHDAEQKQIETNKKLLLLPTKNDVVINPGNKITIVVYEDTDCRFCREYEHILDSVAQKNPDVVSLYFRYKLLPIYRHSRVEAELLECVKKINTPAYSDFKKDLFSINSSENLDLEKLLSMAYMYADKNTLRTCSEDTEAGNTVRDIEATASILGVTKVPYTFIFSETSPLITLVGVQSESALKQIIENIQTYE